MDREDTNAKQRGGGILTAEVIRSSRIVDCVIIQYLGDCRINRVGDLFLSLRLL